VAGDSTDGVGVGLDAGVVDVEEEVGVVEVDGMGSADVGPLVADVGGTLELVWGAE